MRQRRRHAIGQVGRADPVQRRQASLAQPPLVPVRMRQAAQRRPEPGPGVPGGAHHHVLQHRQATEQAHALKCPGDPESGQLMRPDPGQVLSIEPHPAGLGPDETAYCVEQRRLSSAVRSDYSGDLLGHRHERHVIESSQTTEAHRQILDVQ